MMTPPATAGALPIVQYWHDGEIPSEIAELTATFRALNPDMPYAIFDESEATNFVELHFGPREAATFRACAVPSMQGDYFSYCAAVALGGVYCDVGFRCLRPVGGLLGSIDEGVLFRMESGVVIHGFFAFKLPRHPLPRLALDIATANIERRVAERVNMVTGPWIFNGLLQIREAETLDLAPPDSKVDAEALAASFRETIGDYGRVEEAFEGIKIAPLRETEWIAKPDRPLAYKESDLDWVNWCGRGETIFR